MSLCFCLSLFFRLGMSFFIIPQLERRQTFADNFRRQNWLQTSYMMEFGDTEMCFVGLFVALSISTRMSAELRWNISWHFRDGVRPEFLFVSENESEKTWAFSLWSFSDFYAENRGKFELQQLPRGTKTYSNWMIKVVEATLWWRGKLSLNVSNENQCTSSTISNYQASSSTSLIPTLIVSELDPGLMLQLK